MAAAAEGGVAVAVGGEEGGRDGAAAEAGFMLGDVTHGSVGIEAEARMALASLATQLVRPDGMLSTLDRDRAADPSVEERLGMLTDRLRDATGELLSVLELTRSRMIGVELLQAHANQARVLLQLYDEHQQMVEELLRSQRAEAVGGAPGPTDGLEEEEVKELLLLAARLARLPTAKLLGGASSCECVICQAELRDVAGSLLPAGTGGDKEPCMLQCGHKFHRHCIGSWLRRSKKCPLCRAEQSLAKLSEVVAKPLELPERLTPETPPAATCTRRTTVSLTPPARSATHDQDRPRTVSVSAWQSDGGSATSGFAGSSEAGTRGSAALLQNRPSTTQPRDRMPLRHSASRGTSRGASRGSSRGAFRSKGLWMNGRDSPDLPARPATSEASDAARLMRRRVTSNGLGGVNFRDGGDSRGTVTRSASSPLAPLRSSATGVITPGVYTDENERLSSSTTSASEFMVLRGHGDSQARARQQAREQARNAARLTQVRKRHQRPGHNASSIPSLDSSQARRLGTPIRSLGSQARTVGTELPVRRRLSFQPRQAG